MKCRYCRKNVRSIAHFMQAHKSLMLRKMRAGRGRRPKGGKRSKGSHAPSGGHYCPMCGRKHG